MELFLELKCVLYIICCDEYGNIKIKCFWMKRDFVLEEFLVMILWKLVDEVSCYLGEEVIGVVIIVLVYFNDF